MARRTTIEVDDVLLRAAQDVLGTTGLKDTVDSALTEVVRAARRRRLADRLASGDGFDAEALAPTAREHNWGRAGAAG